MYSVVCVCALVLLAAAGRASNVAKGLYCQDPDTGKLYPVNTTWPSESFCGNYTCKLRKKNITETEYKPIKKIDVTKFHIPIEKHDMAISPSDTSFKVTENTDNDIQPIYDKNFLKNNVKDNKKFKDNNDYLTESEIKTITDILHTIKKSDLEAIIDIYNLAQEIYKEIDDVRKGNLLKFERPKDTVKLDKNEKVNDEQSYWYDPAQYHNKQLDMSSQQTNIMSTKKPYTSSSPTLYKEPLSDKGFLKLPYYYPISDFQRLSSYTHKPNTKDLENAQTVTKPCNKPANNYKYESSPGYAMTRRPEAIATVQPATLLPYPFSHIYHYNVSGYPSNYYYNYPWTHVDFNRLRNYPQPYYGPYIVQYPNNSAKSTSSIPEEQKLPEFLDSGELLIKLKKGSLEKKPLPDWQTSPLSDKVIDEVRANLDKPRPLKLTPLKKNIKLERVGKVIKLDELTRTKRYTEINDIKETYSDELETYIEKTICENSTEPGYFSIGNMSQPYPACCPRKLDSIHTAREKINVN